MQLPFPQQMPPTRQSAIALLQTNAVLILQQLRRSQLRINMFAGTASAVVSIAVVGVSYPVYLHYLGLEQYGLWLVLSTIIAIAQLGNLGLAPAVSKLVAQEVAKLDVESGLKYVTIAGTAVILSGTLIGGALIGARHQIVLFLNLAPSYR
jgi:O-antigen/teichoic acid export membrane protein